MDRNYTMRALVYDTVVCGKETTCLHKFIIRETEEEFEEMRQKEIRESGLNLRYDDTVELLQSKPKGLFFYPLHRTYVLLDRVDC